ncbi:unnamed protein product [Microthlaspi erraticum]|uniref:Uncharacterized protein n=1 Tax=Microthlaspi erraticum TaxID=1685480 RepID=A0A6D2JAU3_9BRAS|nr:unnamed protein product [Microthlaspi erraticum]
MRLLLCISLILSISLLRCASPSPVAVSRRHVEFLRTKLSSSLSFISPEETVRCRIRLPHHLTHPLPEPPDLQLFSALSPTDFAFPNVLGVAARDLCSGVISGDDLFRCGVSDGPSWNTGVHSRSPPNHNSFQSPRPTVFIGWAWPNMPYLGRLLSTCFKPGPIVFVAYLDRLVSSLLRSCNAGMFSTPHVWEMFNISPSSVGMERSFPPSSFHKERSFPHPSFSMRSGLFSVSRLSKFYNILTVLSSYVMVCRGSKGATGFASSYSGGRSWFSTSKSHSIVSRLHQSGLAVISLPTHLSFAYNLLSYKDLSILCFNVFTCYGSFQRGWFILSKLCNTQA